MSVVSNEFNGAPKHDFFEIGLKPFRIRANGWGLLVVLVLAGMFFAGVALGLWSAFPFP